MFSKTFWLLAAERAVKSFAQALAALLGAGGLDLIHAPWYTLLSTAGMAAVLSVLTSIASIHVGPQDVPSVIAAAPTSAPASPTSPVGSAVQAAT